MLGLTAPIVLTPLITFIHPEDYDFEKFKELKQVDDRDLDASLGVSTASVTEHEHDVGNSEKYEADLLKARNWAIGAALFITISLTILWPIPMYGSGYVFSKKFFTGWIAFTFIWGFFGAITITGLPLWESRRDILLVFSTIVDDLRGRRHVKETSEVDGEFE
jgi:urea-proton symporter